MVHLCCRYMKDFKPLTVFDITENLKQHRKWGMVDDLLRERMPEVIEHDVNMVKNRLTLRQDLRCN